MILLIKIPPFDSALEFVLITDVKCITKQQYSSDLWHLSLKAKRNCIVDKSLKTIKLIIKKCSSQYVWSLITLVSLVFSFSAVYQWIRLTSQLHFYSILSPKALKIFYFERFKAQFNPSVRTNVNWRLTVLKNVAY
jgi:hypothetical protein